MPHRVGRVLPLAIVVALLGAGSAQGVTVTRPGLGVTVMATVAPKRLPTQGGTPVTLTIKGSTTHTASETSDTLSVMELLLDPQLATDTKGLPRCSAGDLANVESSIARQRCGDALIGSGELTETYELAERAPFDARHTILFFNGGGSVLAYRNTSLSSAPAERFPAGAEPIGNGRRLKLPVGSDAASATSFRFTFGRTWRSTGKTYSYLNGQCRTGTISNRFILKIRDGTASTVTDASSERCTNRR